MIEISFLLNVCLSFFHTIMWLLNRVLEVVGDSGEGCWAGATGTPVVMASVFNMMIN
jgi:hypothetical protein